MEVEHHESATTLLPLKNVYDLGASFIVMNGQHIGNLLPWPVYTYLTRTTDQRLGPGAGNRCARAGSRSQVQFLEADDAGRENRR